MTRSSNPNPSPNPNPNPNPNRNRNRNPNPNPNPNQVYDPELYEEATSDPYIVFSIDPPSNPGCKIFRRCDLL